MLHDIHGWCHLDSMSEVRWWYSPLGSLGLPRPRPLGELISTVDARSTTRKGCTQYLVSQQVECEFIESRKYTLVVESVVDGTGSS